MLVITKQAETVLKDNLKIHNQKKTSIRCLHLKFSLIGDKADSWFDTFLEKIEFSDWEKDIEIYRCDNDDVYMLGYAFTDKYLHSLLLTLPQALQPTDHDELAALHEVGIHYRELIESLENKINKHKNIKTETIELDFVDVDSIFARIDPALIQSLPERRNNRKEPRIMIVEDDIMYQKLLNNALSNNYDDIYISNDGASAIASYVIKAPDILFLDIGLPDINGHQILEKLVEIDPFSFIVMFSGNGDKENVVKAISNGAKGFVGKPFSIAKVNDYIEKSPLIKQKNKDKSYASLAN